MIRGLRYILGLFALLSTVAGCGNGLSSTDCCSSGQFYSCSSASQVTQCVTNMPNTCTREASKDSSCQVP